MRRVVVTGIGLLTPLGQGTELSWKAILAGKSGAGRITTFDPADYACQVACEVPRVDGRGGGGPAGALAGYALLLGASLAWSVAILVTRRFPPQRPVMDLLPWCFGLGALLLLPMALLREPAGGIGREAWPHAAFVGAVAAPVGTWATIEAGRRLSGMVASLGFLAIPAFGVALSNLWLGEALGWDVLLGGALILGSVAIAARGG